MSNPNYEALHLALNIESLDKIVKQKFNLNLTKFEQYISSLKRLYDAIMGCAFDQEKRYVLIVRYLIVFKEFVDRQADPKFIELQYGREHRKIMELYEETQKSLRYRYITEAQYQVDTAVAEDSFDIGSGRPSHAKIFDTPFITAKQLFSALRSNLDILVVDARSESDFAESTCNARNTINVPDHCVTPGLSANILSKKLPDRAQKLWENRDKFDAVVLMDWSATAENLKFSKLNDLRAAMTDWDPNRIYTQQPVILSEGFMNLLQTYPTLCTNPSVVLKHMNTELDELLDLDAVVYPSESDSFGQVMGEQEESEEMDDSEPDEPPEVNQEVLVSKIIFLQSEIVDLEMEAYHLDNLKEFDPEAGVRAAEKRKQADRYRAELAECKPMKDIDNDVHMRDVEEPNKVNDDKEKKDIDEAVLKEIISDQRMNALEEARKMKPKSAHDATTPVLARKAKPAVNRANKPSNSSLALEIEPKPTGLKNIRNTCYMNTLVQCLGCLPPVRELFLKGGIANYKIREPPAIINETCDLIQKMWTTKNRVTEPNLFYKKICALESMYKKGNHEDCMEFFLFLLNRLSEDCFYEAKKTEIMTPRQIAWHNQFQGKNSVFIDYFYHQIRITQDCQTCHKKTYKFDMENSFMLSVNSNNFDIGDMIRGYMEPYCIPNFRCSTCKQPVKNFKEFCFQPKIVVVMLKRYAASVNVGYEKLQGSCTFPVKGLILGKGTYDLFSIAMHSGTLSFGHYSAACLTELGWFECNDEEVKPIRVNDEKVRNGAYAFFYCLRDTDN